MPLADQIKNYARKLTEDRPDERALAAMLRDRPPRAWLFADDGIVPNHPRWPLIVYRRVITANARQFELATVLDTMFASNGWGRSWRDTVYDFVHYHSHVHEVLGVARGSARLEFGGIKGRRLLLKAGDVAILPAGTGHRLLDASRNFLVVGAYPRDGAYDECTDTRGREKNAASIARTRKPDKDPVYGRHGPLRRLWKR